VAKLKMRRTATRRYEAVYIFDSALDDAVINEKLDRLQGLLSLGEAAEIEHWGRRALAYKIGRHENGYYIITRFLAEPKFLPEFERALKLDEGVIRYLVTILEHDLGAPKLSDEELAARRLRADDDDDDDEE
jgi:small subunit ribosomal protein S6